MDDPEATQLILETLFDAKVVVHEIRDAIVGDDEDDEEAEEDT